MGKIVITYPEFDWTAREIVSDVSYLLSLRGINVYVPSKNYPRIFSEWKEKVEPKLKSADSFLFVAHDVDRIDPNTLWELKVLSQNQIPGFLILPRIIQEHKEIKSDGIDIFKYAGISDLKKALQFALSKLEKTEIQEKSRNLVLLLVSVISLLMLIVSPRPE